MSLEVAQNVETETKTEIVGDAIAVKPIVVKAVVLRSDGTLTEIDYEIAPKKNTAKDIVGAPPTIIGEWDEIQVILIRGKHGSVNVPFSQHKLRYPFNGRQFRGDILLYRVNKDGKPENFTLQEYEVFTSKPDENAGKDIQEPCMDAVLEQSLLESSYVEEHGDEEEEAMSEEDLRREIAEAFEIIRAKGRHDAQYLAELVSETFYEINGREAELEDIANVFKRVKEQLAEEANDEVLDDSEEEVDQITAAIKNLLATNQATTQVVENREELLNHARSVVNESTAAEAREKFAKIAGRESTSQEFEDLLINLSKSKGSEIVAENEEDDSDYCPLDETEQEQARADELEDLDKESEEEDKENEETTQEPIVDKKPIKFFSPVRTKKTAERLAGGLDSVDRKLMDRVVQHFRNIHKREPTEQENVNLWKFLTTGGLPVCELENEKDNEDSKSPDIKKVNFDSEDEESEVEEIVHVVD